MDPHLGAFNGFEYVYIMTELSKIVTTSSHIMTYTSGDIGNYHLFIEEIYYDYIVKILRTFVQIVANVLGGIFLMSC